MKRKIILDTGPLVAVLNLRDTYRDWTKAQFSKVEALLLSRMCNVRPDIHLADYSKRSYVLSEGRINGDLNGGACNETIRWD